jgi:hypothetical protein
VFEQSWCSEQSKKNNSAGTPAAGGKTMQPAVFLGFDLGVLLHNPL